MPDFQCFGEKLIVSARQVVDLRRRPAKDGSICESGFQNPKNREFSPFSGYGGKIHSSKCADSPERLAGVILDDDSDRHRSSLNGCVGWSVCSTCPLSSAIIRARSCETNPSLLSAKLLGYSGHGNAALAHGHVVMPGGRRQRPDASAAAAIISPN